MITVRPVTSEAEREACARLMAGSEPWITLGRGYEASLVLLSDPERDVFSIDNDGRWAGFLVLCLRGPFSGYLQTICVVPERRGAGVGTAALRWAEQRIFEDSPNVFLCVSSFNDGARRLYERDGYEYVGELVDFLVRGHSELLYRKTRGPWSEHRRQADTARPR